MKSQQPEPLRTPASLWSIALLLLCLALLILLGGCASPNAAPSQTIQPALRAWLETQPQQSVQIIVQKRGVSDAPEKYVVALGGRVLQDLRLINGFAAKLPAGAVAALAQHPNVRWVSLDAPMVETATSAEPQPAFVTWATKEGSMAPNSFQTSWYTTDSALGPAGTFAPGNRAAASFAGFTAEISDGYRIAKVEAVLTGYSIAPLTKKTKLLLYLDGTKVAGGEAGGPVFSSRIGAQNAGPVYVDVTGKRTWTWGDFDGALELVVDQTAFEARDWYFLDAVGLRVWIEPGADKTGNTLPGNETPNAAIAGGRQVNVYNTVIGTEALWREDKRLQGNGVGVAVVDSGVERTGDLAHIKIVDVNFNRGYHDSKDRYGHGTFVAGVIAGNGNSSHGIHVGVAPRTRLINVRVSDDSGKATASDVVAGLQWIYENKTRYNIRVVNLSLNSSIAASYLEDPLCAAVEMLWLRGIVVVVSAGNNGTATLYPPANDPFVITVGATDDAGTPALADDSVAGFSGYGLTELGQIKPDIVAPGSNIIGYLPNNKSLRMPAEHPTHSINNYYFRMSGTSVAAPMVSGAVALLLQDEPSLSPDQVKYRLAVTANQNWAGYNHERAGAGYLDVYAAVRGSSLESANGGLPVSRLLWNSLARTSWSSVNWNSVNWNSVNWNSVNWNSVNWNSVNWNSVNWNSVNWNSVNWNSDYWDPLDLSAAAAADIPAVKRLFELLATETAAGADPSGSLYLPAIIR